MQSNLETRWAEALSNECEAWELAEFDNAALRKEAFSRNVTFGTGGIRALMGIGPNRLNRLTVTWATAGLAAHLHDSCRQKPSVVIAYDTRIHSKSFALTTAQVLVSSGCTAYLFKNPQPTPVLSFAVRQLGCDAGVVITASHNPKEYNGYKVYDHTGDQATDALAKAIADKLKSIDPFQVADATSKVDAASESISLVPDEVVGAYLQAILEQSTEVDCSDLRVAYTPLNGTGLEPVTHVLGKRGVDYVLVKEQTAPDGTFPTCPKPNPELPEAMRAVCDLARLEAADLALANDPDADRIGVAVRHEGDMLLLTGDEVGLLLLDFLCSVIPPTGHPVAVSTIVSTPLLETVAERHGVELRRTLTGFKYVGEQIGLLEQEDRTNDFLCGIEESCGYLRGSYVRDKDGVVSLMLVCEMAAWHKHHGRDLVDALNDLYERYRYMVSRQVSLTTDAAAVVASLRENLPHELGGIEVSRVLDYKDGAPMPGDTTQTLPASNVLQLDLVDGSRVMIRPSGTEPKVKAYCFAAGASSIDANMQLELLCAAAKKLLEVKDL